ncbi:hypothetical protein FA09DRAFT_336951 [Tilletiopsis washingtonensis]|uniref:AAR2 N-terminal domain-containing protein n=1 Tax=Tilletiopsis washingtonensis TaxID=58919 RepID=A0A316ZIK3_9BASI|nr:hypothetical protein FA09DRAFT_336951 [Tilletiopsis washingtonensis]PWO00124.1 hypothetical protein FA09DRAFT_336951 [Tilletiopsis washingtonensis]
MSLHLSPPLPAHATLHLDGLDFPQPLPLARIARLPRGWHLLAWQPAPHSSGGMPGAPPRRGIFFRTTHADDETRRAWDQDAQSLRSSSSSSSSSSDSDAEAEADSALAPAASSSSSSAHRGAAVPYPLPAPAQRAWAMQTRLLWRVPHVLPRVLCGAVGAASSELHIDASQSLVHAELPRGQRASRAERALEAHLNDSKSERFRGTLAFTRDEEVMLEDELGEGEEAPLVVQL